MISGLRFGFKILDSGLRSEITGFADEVTEFRDADTGLWGIKIRNVGTRSEI